MSHGRKRNPAAEASSADIGGRNGGSDCPVIIAGIGASADGLNSLKQLFAGMPKGYGVAFVVVQHRGAAHESRSLLSLLRDETPFTVVEATEGMAVLADRIHVMSADKFLNVAGARLSTQEPVYCDGVQMPIDHFFCSLAVDQKQRGCGILLSGTGSDGMLGLSEIKSAGGRTIVEHPGMAQSVMDSGLVDAVLSVDTMAVAVLTMVKRVVESAANEPQESPEFDADLRAILEILRVRAGHDFRCYKPNTIVRRIRRRMAMGKAETFAEYSRFLQEHPDEVPLLQKDLLIGVTEFFRQPDAWEVLEERVIIPLVRDGQPGSEIRVWVPGCSTGKEAYTLAMLLAEQVEKSGKKLIFQIFATDSDAGALETARSGVYSEDEIGENVSTERRRRFFSRKDGRYQIIKEIRKSIVFAPQNLTADPPFSRIDLVSCRNLLIYLEQQVQRKIIAMFHFALREGGFLFLGSAESIGDREDLFEPVSKKWRIYRRIGVGRPVGLEIPVHSPGEPQPRQGMFPAAVPVVRFSLAAAAQQMLLDRFAPACVMIDRKYQVLYVHGPVEKYLTFPSGELTTKVVDMAREGLRGRLRGAIGRCIEANRSVSVTARVRRGEKSVPVKSTVSHLRYPKESDGLLLVTFQDYRMSAPKSRIQATGNGVQQLEDELKITREELQSTIGQLESSNDLLKASNEEVTAANEELQSANEELETSKEELQFLNEELNTINARLQEKVDELESANNDLLNLLSSTSIATVFLDRELRVRRYTQASTLLFSLIPTDVGRPIADVLRRFKDEPLLEDAARVLADLTSLAKEVKAVDGRWYIRRITPYRTQDDRIEGVVVTFVDVCDLKETEEALRRKQAELEAARAEAERLATFPMLNPQPVIEADLDGRLFFTNPSAERLFPDLQARGLDHPWLADWESVAQACRETSVNLAAREVTVGGRWYHQTMHYVEESRRVRIYGSDISERKKGEEALRKARDELEIRVQERTAELAEINEELQVEVDERMKAEKAREAERQRLYDVLETLPVYVVLMTEDHRVPFANRFFRERFGESRGMRCFEYLFGRTEPCEVCESFTVLKTSAPHHWEWTGPDGRNYDIFDFPFTDKDGSRLVMEMGIDITERKRAEEQLRSYMGRLEQSNRDLEDFAYVACHDLQEPARKIQTFTDWLVMMHQERLDEKACDYLERIRGSAERMQTLVVDLLRYSRLSTDPAPFTFFNLKTVVEDAATDLGMLFAETGGGIEIGELPDVEADKVQMRQLFQNLIANALRYRSEQKPLIQVVEHSSVSGKFREIHVKDNGIGFDESYADKIFKPFQRLHGKNTLYPGNGMGLAICRRIVERHGGSITAKSKPGQGSTFIVTLPRKRPT